MPYIGRSLGDGVRARYIYSATSGQTTFSGNDANSIALAYSDTLYMDVYQNGVLLKPVTDYASTTGTSVVLVTGASTSDVVEMIVYDSFAVADTVSAANGGTFSGNMAMSGTLAVTGAITSSAGATITTADNNAQLTLKSTDADGSVGPVLDLVRDSASPADGDAVGQIKFIADNDAGEATTYSSGFTTLRDASDGAEDGQTINYVMANGALVDHLRMGRGSAGGQSEVVINEGSADLDFRVESDGNANMLFVDASSNVVLVGSTDTSPFNNTSASGISLSANEIQIASSSSEGLYLNRYGSNGRVVNIRKGGSFIGGIDVSTSQVTYNQTSDYRLKENVSYTWDATARLKQLKPARFNYIVDPDNIVDGFLAHEVSEACPSAITGEKDAVDSDGNIDPQCIDHSKLVPLLCKTILELEARITALEAG